MGISSCIALSILCKCRVLLNPHHPSTVQYQTLYPDNKVSPWASTGIFLLLLRYFV